MTEIAGKLEGTGRNKYLVSGDLRVIVGRWLGSKGPFFLPDKKLFESLQSAVVEKLEEIFQPRGVDVVYLPWDHLKTGILLHIANHAGDVPVVSLDQVYVEEGTADIYLDANRIVKWSKHTEGVDWRQGWSEIGHGPRRSDYGIASQLERIVNQGRIKRMQDKRVVVVDDGTWTRGSLIAAKNLLASVGIRVDKFIVGIEIRSGTEKDETFEIPFLWVEKFCKEAVVDWVGERDFFPGVGFSGRTVGELIENNTEPATFRQFYISMPMEGNYGAPYVMPLGDPVTWANVPEKKAIEFSMFCLDCAIQLYTAIEAETRRITGQSIKIKVSHLERPPYFYRKIKDMPVTEALASSRKILENI